ncbi:hypothetical protein QH494_27890 [Sphingomonas sp. AR_OL41]|uniref:hypothetical protein n=1 Tax=Sphingomonas sp. AR_OL41 TaxID=3042729 RepID=UPI0024813CFF|nr:hypothetical protein [Sphingomonas sp. AR_OL41]MDH7976017.1 hypothetical protein [Sphingomonas sp. AR_OL41]
MAIGGIFCIYLGWKLYVQGISSPVSSEIAKGEQWKFTLKALGPGVFFALFGMWILVRTIDNQTTIDPAESDPVEQQGNQSGLSISDLLVSPARAAEPGLAQSRPMARVCFRYPRIRMSNGQSFETRDFQAAIDDSVLLLKKGSFRSEENERVNKTILVMSRLASPQPAQ